MSPELTLVEFISTSASYFDVKQQRLSSLEADMMKVFGNNVLPANAAAWYMGRRINYDDCQILADILRRYPKKFLVKNDMVHYLEEYQQPVSRFLSLILDWGLNSVTIQIARAKLKEMTKQGLVAYFNHKVDECGVYFFDPLYYEVTEPFHVSLRQVRVFVLKIWRKSMSLLSGDRHAQQSPLQARARLLQHVQEAVPVHGVDPVLDGHL